MVVTDEELISLTHALKGLCPAETCKRSSPGRLLVARPEVAQGGCFVECEEACD